MDFVAPPALSTIYISFISDKSTYWKVVYELANIPYLKKSVIVSTNLN